jgi:hypothetical protein
MAKQSYIIEDLEWLDAKLKSLRDYVDNNPFETLEDRLETVMSAKGTPVIKIIARKEDQIKEIRACLKEYIIMLADLNKLREARAVSDMELRGGGSINGMMKAKLEKEE